MYMCVCECVSVCCAFSAYRVCGRHVVGHATIERSKSAADEAISQHVSGLSVWNGHLLTSCCGTHCTHPFTATATTMAMAMALEVFVWLAVKALRGTMDITEAMHVNEFIQLR